MVDCHMEGTSENKFSRRNTDKIFAYSQLMETQSLYKGWGHLYLGCEKKCCSEPSDE